MNDDPSAVDTPLRGQIVERYNAAAPARLGQYSWRMEPAEAINVNAICVDFSVAKNGVRAAYC